MNPHEVAVKASQCVEMVEAEIGALQAGQGDMKEMLWQICADLSLYMVGSESGDAELIQLSQQSLKRHGKALSTMSMVHVPFKSNSAFTYKRLASVLEEIADA